MAKYLLVSVVVLSGVFVEAGVVINKSIKSKNTVGESTLKIDTNFYRADTFQSGELQASVIYDKTQDIMYFFTNHPKEGKVYYEISRGAIAEAKKNPKYKAAAQKAKDSMNKGLAKSADMTKMLDKMKPAQRAMFEKMMKAKGMQTGSLPTSTRDIAKVPSNEYKKASGTKDIAGYKCSNWDVFVMNNKSAQICGATKFKALDKYSSLFSSAQKLSKEWGSFISETFGFGGSTAQIDLMFNIQKKVGFPLETTQFNSMTGSVQNVETVKSISEQSLSKSDFSHPAGYKKIHFFDLFASR